MAFRNLLLLSAAALALVSSTASAQRWGHEREPRDGACFYRDADFRGEYFCLESGRTVGELPHDINDAISSVRIFGRAEVFVYQDRRLSGRSLRLDHNTGNLRREGWNDLVSSLEVRSARGGDPANRYERPGASSREVERVVTRAYQDLLGRNPDQAGMRIYRSHMIDDGWTEGQVRDALRKSPEYQKVSVARAHEVVRKAYLNVLKREPDAAASGYTNKVLREHWTQADIERELRKSPEYRRGGR